MHLHVLGPPVLPTQSTTQSLAATEFRLAWDGLLYRFAAFSEHHTAAERVVRMLGDEAREIIMRSRRVWTPREGTMARQEASVNEVFQHLHTSSDRYVLDRELFGFFVNGLAALECWVYASFAAGALLAASQRFRLELPGQRTQVSTKQTAGKYEGWQEGRRSDVKAQLDLLRSDETNPDSRLWKWQKTRNILLHRATPIQEQSIGLTAVTSDFLEIPPGAAPQFVYEVTFEHFTVNDRELRDLRDWLAQRVTTLVRAMDTFTSGFSPTVLEQARMPQPAPQWAVMDDLRESGRSGDAWSGAVRNGPDLTQG